MHMRTKAITAFLAVMLITILPLSAGCSDRDTEKLNFAEALKKDAINSLKSAYAEDFTRISIIRGSLYKFVVNPRNPQNLGVAIGAIEATVFPEEYELQRFNQLENISAQMRKDIISQPMLSITLKKREVLNHIYNSVLKPLSLKIENGKNVTPQETEVLSNLINLLDTLAQNYSVLANKDVDFNGSEAQRSFLSIQNSLREMQNLELVKQAN